MFKSGFIAALLSLGAYGVVIDNANIISEAVEIKLNLIGEELKSKTGVSLDLLTISDLNGSTLENAASSHISNLKPPYIVLAILPKDFSSKAGKLDIFASNDALELFDKEAVLSPFPQTGSIIPLLTQNKGKDIYNSSMLNGYADIADRVANSKNITLETSIGSQNRDTINIFRYLIYGTIIFVLIVLFMRKFKKANNAKS
ncbi:TPM domain-containing protein [Campylobacter lanienae]|uniref:TPM domain-containing protein n=1 Tax=Campylobacter lanienae TaxID=75658 RepID=A0ABY3G813_9BACT|nr:TPM domain-containing protein [Campylobacter lanienae]